MESRLFFHYDYQQRILREEVIDSNGNLLKQTTNTYDTNHLLSTTDPEGIVTTYTYDSAGRLLIVKHGDSLTSYEYDALGRKHKTFQQYGDEPTQYTVLVQEYDLLNQIIEERTEDPQGKVLIQTSYAYDTEGNQTLIMKYAADGTDVTLTEYNDLKLPVKITNGLQQTTLIHYNFEHVNTLNQRVQQRTTVDPKGNCLITTLDAHGKTVLVVHCNAVGEVLSRQEYDYDGLGNKVRARETVITPDQDNRVVINCWQFDTGNRLIAQTEAFETPEQKITRYSYNAYGEKTEIIKSDGIILCHTYNPLGALETFRSSDNTVSYSYTYNASGKPTQVIDNINENTLTRSYDHNGRLENEILASGLHLQYAYDRMGRPTQLVLPDGSYVNYQYDSLYLRQVERNGNIHQYLEYDTSGKLLEEQLCDSSRIQYRWDILGRLIQADANQRKAENYVYDECGNLLGYSQDNQTYRFAYDDLNQIKEEEGLQNHSYQHDSLYNRVQKDEHHYKINALNQILHDGINQYVYDYNGNLIKEVGEQTTEYQYDALDRLVAVIKPDEKVSYQYDAFNRRLSRTITKNGQSQAVTQFIYQGDDETGTMQDGKIVELRVLGTGKGAEIGASVLIEIKSVSYIPLHDHNGNIIRLLDMNGNLIERYDYTAFGEETITDALNKPVTSALIPWRFSSKRHDEESGFQFFGRRYYAPKLGRWITQDPIGFSDGPNLYAYVLNRPLTHNDHYGLWGVGEHSGYGATERAVSLIAQRDQAEKQAAKNPMGYAGQLIDVVASNLIPIPVVREIVSCIGRVLCGQPITFRAEGFSHSAFYSAGEEHVAENERFIYCNGIMTTFEEAQAHAEWLSKEFGGTKFDCTYNSTYGLFSDLLECVIEKFGFHTQPVKEMIKNIQDRCNELEGVPGAVVNLLLHSEGAIIGYRALRTLNEKELKMIQVKTFGGAAMIFGEEYMSAKNYISRDIVPIFDLIGIVYGYCQHKGYIEFISPGAGPIVDHFLRGGGYENTIKDIASEFKSKHGLI